MGIARKGYCPSCDKVETGGDTCRDCAERRMKDIFGPGTYPTIPKSEVAIDYRTLDRRNKRRKPVRHSRRSEVKAFDVEEALRKVKGRMT